MRKLIFSHVISLDGFTSSPDGEFVPPPWSDDVAKKWSDWALESGGPFIYGRVSFEFQKAFWTAAARNETLPQATRDFAAAYNRAPRFVVSKTLTGDPGWNAKQLIGVDQVGALKAEAGSDLICLGGANLAQSLHETDLIDEYRLMLAPYTMGGGKRLFGTGPRRDFALVETLTTDVGSLILTYARKC
jgi:dihydrofolate reductase